jgi:hypothetical protein
MLKHRDIAIPTAANCGEFVAMFLACSLVLVADLGPAVAAGCAFAPQGEGRVAAVIDARSFRLEDGREIKLAGIEPAGSGKDKEPSEKTIQPQRFRRCRRLLQGES